MLACLGPLVNRICNAGGGHFQKGEFSIAPEALLLATTCFASQDPRLLPARASCAKHLGMKVVTSF